MREPREVVIQSRGEDAPKIRQRFWMVSGLHKLDALTRLLEAEKFDAMLVFVRTKLETVELALVPQITGTAGYTRLSEIQPLMVGGGFNIEFPPNNYVVTGQIGVPLSEYIWRFPRLIQAAKLGAHVATLPPAVIKTLYKHPLTDKGLESFLADWKKTGQSIL